jgi:hypothetical protein
MRSEPTFTCATCDLTIQHHPVFFLGLAFCCPGCAADGPCMCSYDAADSPEAAVPAVEAAVERAGTRGPAVPDVAPTAVPAVPVGAPASSRELVGARRR